LGLKVENIKKIYGDKIAVNNISFEIEEPGVFGLLGTNGAGKTTTIRMILGIIRKDEGKITWNDREVIRENVNFGYLPEERGIYAKIKIYDQLAYFAELKGMDKTAADKAIKYWMDRLKLEEYTDMTAEKLSKGNQQKVQFVTAVINDPELVVLDEPFSGMDPVNTELLKDVILELVGKGKYIVMSAHQMASIEEFCKDIIIINKGKSVLQGNLNNIKNSYPSNTVELITKDCMGGQNSPEELIASLNLKIKESRENHYEIGITEEKQGYELYKLLADRGIQVIKFEIKKPSLNEIFIEKVGENE